MSSGPAYRDRGGGGGGGDRGDSSYRGGYNNNRGGNFRGRGGTGYKPRRYWDSDDFYKDEREHGGRGRRRRSYSRSRSRSHSRSYSRSRSRSPPPRRARSRSPPRQPEEYVPRPAEHAVPNPYEPYVPTKDPAETWTGSRLPVTQEYVPQANGQTAAALSQMNPYGNVESMYPPQYAENPTTHSQAQVGYGYGHTQIPVTQYHQQSAPDAGYSQQHISMGQMGTVAPPPPAISSSKPDKDDHSDTSKKKKEKRKKKKRHHSSSSSSSSSDDSSSESRRRRKSKKGRGTGGSSDSSSEDDKKDSGTSGRLTEPQKDALLKQRESYQSKLDILEREIKKLQNKEDELIRSRAERQLIDENLKLQAELRGRCKAVIIVLEKIDDVLKVGGKSSSEKTKVLAPQPAVPPPPSLAPMIPPSQPDRKPFNDVDKKSGLSPFDYFDNSQHWCRLCNVFPETVQQMLAHFHSKEHHDQIQQLGIDEKPWHKRNSLTDSKSIPGAKKAPFRGNGGEFNEEIVECFIVKLQMIFICIIVNMHLYYFLLDTVPSMFGMRCLRLVNDVCSSSHQWKDGTADSVTTGWVILIAQWNILRMLSTTNFLEEHPDWEHKWVNDRERALGVSGKQEVVTPSGKKSRFDDPHPRIIPERKLSTHVDDVESGKSIRVQMRNSLKPEEKEQIPKFTASLTEHPPSKDSGLEEWMNKPKVALDIDTQKFAAIVRQKHGAKEKEMRDSKNLSSPNNVKPTPTPPPQSSLRDRDLKKDDRRRTDKVELQISNRDRDRDRYRDRDSRNSRRRRRSRSRSRSRSRDRSDRDRRERVERERPDIKEAVKKLPMIGKMPLYKRPVLNKEKSEIEEKKVAAVDVPPVTRLPAVGLLPKRPLLREESHLSAYSNSSLSNTGFNYGTHQSYAESYGLSAGMGSTGYSEASITVEPTVEQDRSASFHHSSSEVHEELPSAEVKTGDKEGAPTALPDDFQQALDIIYSVPGPVPQPVPPPAGNGISGDSSMPGSTAEYEYGSVGSNGYPNYLGYQPYQQSFDGYAPVGYEELDDGPPGVGDDSSSVGAARQSTATASSGGEQQMEKTDVVDRDPPPPGEDDLDDLRMLGIDVDDTAVVVKK
ncbi:hypothetical protein Ocin01_11509 [Orchesella cincta]|uniref:Zinc finger matrin-type protein CG9776 n=1 Tax=Orchesella cincta TaxID=48709 RepID=A0A1D2MR31_ORCCI|nr:hypothetical protein Ocin01_11509 [Orchesella cincta]